MKKIDAICLVLLIVAAINWGLYGVLDFNIIDYIFERAWIGQIIYFFFGASAIYSLFSWKSILLKK